MPWSGNHDEAGPQRCDREPNWSDGPTAVQPMSVGLARGSRYRVHGSAPPLSLLLEAGQPFDYGEVRDLAEPKVPEAPALTLSGQPDLRIYDRLLTGSLAAAGVCA